MNEPTALVSNVAAARTARPGLHVVFRVGDVEYAAAAADVVQMESFSGATPVPGAPPWVLGLMQVRTKVVPVIDLRRRFGLPGAAPSADDDLDARVVVVARGERIVALRVDRGREVLDLAAEQILPVPPAMAAENGGYLAGIARAGDRLVLILDLDGVLGQETSHAH